MSYPLVKQTTRFLLGTSRLRQRWFQQRCMLEFWIVCLETGRTQLPSQCVGWTHVFVKSPKEMWINNILMIHKPTDHIAIEAKLQPFCKIHFWNKFLYVNIFVFHPNLTEICIQDPFNNIPPLIQILLFVTSIKWMNDISYTIFT